MKTFWMVAMVALMLLLPSTVAAQDVTPPSDAGDVIHAIYAAVEIGDLDAATAMIAEDAVLTLIPAPPGTDGTFEGRDAIRDWYAGLFANHIHSEFSNTITSGNMTLMRLTLSVDDLPIPIAVFDGSCIVQNGMMKSATWVMTPETMAAFNAAIQHAATQALVEQFYAAWQAGDGATLQQILGDGFLNHTPPLPQERGAFIQAAMAAKIAYPDGQWTIEKVVIDGDLVAVHARFATMQDGDAPTGVNEAVFGATSIFRIDGGQLVEHWGTLQMPSPPETVATTVVEVESIESYGVFAGVAYNRHTGNFLGIADGQPYSTRFEIVAPADPSQGNGRLLLEPYHFVGGALGRDGFLGADWLLAQGFSHAAICWEENTDETHPCHGLVFAPGVDLAILADFASAIKAGDLSAQVGQPSNLYGFGTSNSAGPMHRLLLDTRAAGIFDFTLLATTGWPLPLPLEGFPQLPDELPDTLAPPDEAGRVIALQSEADLIVFNGRLMRNQDAQPNYRSYEVAGAPHVPGEFVGDGLNWLPVARAIFRMGDRWVIDDVEPPASIAIDESAAEEDPVYGWSTGIARDDDLNALGGIRLPALALGQAQFIASGGHEAPLFGKTIDLTCSPQADGSARFVDHERFVAQYEEILAALVDAGFLLQADADDMARVADESNVGMLGACP